MTQKKGKGEKASSEDGAAMILEYLRKQNLSEQSSVFSGFIQCLDAVDFVTDSNHAIDISSNLHNKVTKSYTAKALRDLHQNKEIECRVAGKQTVYHALQTSDDNTCPDTLTALDEQIKHLEERLSTFKANDKKARADLHVLTSTPLLSDLRQDIARLESEEKEITARLVSSRENAAVVQVVDPVERMHIEQEWKRWRGLAVRRERACRELWERCSEVVPEGMTRGELWESLGLEGSMRSSGG